MFKQGKRKINTKVLLSLVSARQRGREEGGKGKINLQPEREGEEVDLFAEAPRHLSRWGGNDSAQFVPFFPPTISYLSHRPFSFFLPFFLSFFLLSESVISVSTCSPPSSSWSAIQQDILVDPITASHWPARQLNKCCNMSCWACCQKSTSSTRFPPPSPPSPPRAFKQINNK